MRNDPVPAIAQEREDKLAETRAGMADEMASYRVISKDNGTVQVPVQVAMQLTLPELQAKSPQPSQVPVDPTASVPAPAEDENNETAADESAEPAAEEESAESATE